MRPRDSARHVARVILSGVTRGVRTACQVRGRGAHILCYHSIGDGPGEYSVSPMQFRWQMQYLASNCNVVSMDELVAALATDDTLSDRMVAVTIDDGYESVYSYAAPILAEQGIPATVFLPTEYIEAAGGVAELPSWAQERFLSWRQIRLLSAEEGAVRLTWGSHTMSHDAVSAMPRSAAMRQLRRSAEIIQDETGQTVTGLAYPYGLPSHFRGAMACAPACGYAWAVTGVHGSNNAGHNPYCLSRCKVNGTDDMRLFSRIVAGDMDPWGLLDALR